MFWKIYYVGKKIIFYLIACRINIFIIFFRDCGTNIFKTIKKIMVLLLVLSFFFLIIKLEL